jgi:hypothetical protein
MSGSAISRLLCYLGNIEAHTWCDKAATAMGSTIQCQMPDKEQNSNGEAPLPAVSANTLARCLGVTPKVIYDLAKAGVIERGAGRLFPLEDSVRRYCDHIRRQAGGSP